MKGRKKGGGDCGYNAQAIGVIGFRRNTDKQNGVVAHNIKKLY